MVEMKLAHVVVAAILLSLLIYHLPAILVERGATVKMSGEEFGENVTVTLHENQTTPSEKTILRAYSTTIIEDGEEKLNRENLSIYFIGSLVVSILTALIISVIIKKSFLEKE